MGDGQRVMPGRMFVARPLMKRPRRRLAAPGRTAGELRGKETTMRMLMHVRFPHEAFNEAVKDGSAGEKMNRIIEAAKPEAVYFIEHHGRRSAIMVVDLAGTSKIPAYAEPWFLTFNADVEFHPAMTPEDLRKAGLQDLGKKWA